MRDPRRFRRRRGICYGAGSNICRNLNNPSGYHTGADRNCFYYPTNTDPRTHNQSDGAHIYYADAHDSHHDFHCNPDPNPEFYSRIPVDRAACDHGASSCAIIPKEIRIGMKYAGVACSAPVL